MAHLLEQDQPPASALSETEMPVEQVSKRHKRVALLLLAGLLFLRFPFLLVIAFWIRPTPKWVNPVFIVGTCLLTALLVWWERRRLREFHIDVWWAVALLFQVYCFIVGVALLVAMRRRKRPFPPTRPGTRDWAIVGALLAIAMTLAQNSLHLNLSATRGQFSATLGTLLFFSFIQITNAAVLEEPLFRGFLWGYLRMARWPEWWIWVFQALLFAAGHAYYLGKEPFAQWLIRMTCWPLLFGLLAWRSRSIAPGMVAHGVGNALSDLVMHSRSSQQAITLAFETGAGLGVLLAASLFLPGLLRRRKRQDPGLI